MTDEYHFTDIETIYFTLYPNARLNGANSSFIAFALNELSDEYGLENVANLNTFVNDATNYLYNHTLLEKFRKHPRASIEIRFLMIAQRWYQKKLQELKSNSITSEHSTESSINRKSSDTNSTSITAADIELIGKYTALLEVINNQIRIRQGKSAIESASSNSSSKRSNDDNENTTSDIRNHKRHKKDI